MPCNFDKEKLKKNASLAIYGLTFLFIGVDYAIHLPGLYSYFISIGTDGAYFSYAVAMFASGSLIGGPLFGLFFDRWNIPKLITASGVLCVFLGSFLFVLQNEVAILFGRFLAGIGAGIEGGIVGLISKSSSPASRSKKISILYGLKQIGVILGPLMISIFLGGVEEKCFKQNSYDDDLCIVGINYHNSTGYFQMGFSGILLLLVLVFAQNHEIKQIEPEAQKTAISEIKLRQIKPFKIINEISVVCCFSTMAMYSLQSSTEAILPQFTKYFLGFGAVENSYVYAIAGGSAIFGFLALTIIVRCLKSHEILLTGLSFELFISVILMIALVFVDFQAPWFIPVALPGIVIYALFLSFIISSASTILSRSSPPERQSLMQGIRIALEKVSIILTNLFSGQIYNISTSFASIFILTTTLLTLAVGFVVTSWRVLDVDAVQFLHQMRKIEESEVFENSAFEEISTKPASVPQGSRLRRQTTTEIREEYL